MMNVENIYITTTGSYPYKAVYKLGDLGLICKADSTYFDEGDSRYLPKELLNEQDIQLPKADIFSLAMSIYELASGNPLPQNGDEWTRIREGKITLPPAFSQEFTALLEVLFIFSVLVLIFDFSLCWIQILLADLHVSSCLHIHCSSNRSYI